MDRSINTDECGEPQHPVTPEGLKPKALTWFRTHQKIPGGHMCLARVWTGSWVVLRRTTSLHWEIAPFEYTGARGKVIAFATDLRPFNSDAKCQGLCSGRRAPQEGCSGRGDSRPRTSQGDPIDEYSWDEESQPDQQESQPDQQESQPDQQEGQPDQQEDQETTREEERWAAQPSQISILSHFPGVGPDSVTLGARHRNTTSNSVQLPENLESEKLNLVPPSLQSSTSNPEGSSLSRGGESELVGVRGSRGDRFKEWNVRNKLPGLGDSTPQARGGGAASQPQFVRPSGAGISQMVKENMSWRHFVELCEQEATGEPGPQPEDQGESTAQTQPPDNQGERLSRPRTTRAPEFSTFAIACYILATYVLGVAQAYSLPHYDCRSPLKIDQFAETAACTTEGPGEEHDTSKTYAILAGLTLTTFTGWSCEVLASDWHLECDPAGQVTLTAWPTLERPQPITLEECRRMGEQEVYQPPGQNRTLALQKGEWIYAGVTKEGKLKEKDVNFSCPSPPEPPQKSPGQVRETVTQLQVRVQPEEFRVSQGRIEAQRNHRPLPCLVQEEGCQMGDRTYTWTENRGECNLKRMGTMSPYLTQETWLVDHHRHLLLNQTGKYMVPGCGIAVELTQFPNMYLADLTVPERRQRAHRLPPLSPGERNLHQETATRLEYAIYQLHRQMKAASRPARVKLCQQQRAISGETPVTMATGGFGLAHGEVFYQYNCRIARAEIVEDDRCWRDIPVKGGGFVNPGTRLFTLHSQQVACNQFYPLTIATDEGWVAIMPHLVRQPAPASLPTTHDGAQRAPRFHSPAEAREWQRFIQDATQQQTALHTLTYGDCLATHTCSPGDSQNLPVYHLDQLRAPGEGTGSPVVAPRGWLRDLGTGMALACILLCMYRCAAAVPAALQERKPRIELDAQRQPNREQEDELPEEDSQHLLRINKE